MLILRRIQKTVWVVLLCVTRLDFLKSHFKGPKYAILKSSFARKSKMWWYGMGNSGGSWLREEKKANMWHERVNSGGSWPPVFPRSCTMHMCQWIWSLYANCFVLNIFLSIVLYSRNIDTHFSEFAENKYFH